MLLITILRNIRKTENVIMLKSKIANCTHKTTYKEVIH